MPKHAFAFVAIMFLAGCAATSPGYSWRHENASEQQFYADNSQCMAMSSQGSALQYSTDTPNEYLNAANAGSNDAIAAAAQQRQVDIHAQCMLGRGYWLEETAAQ